VATSLPFVPSFQFVSFFFFFSLCFFNLQFYGDAERDAGIKTSQNAHFYAIAASFPKFSNKDKDLVIQYTAKHEQNLDCGGGYLKIGPSTVDLKDFHGESKASHCFFYSFIHSLFAFFLASLIFISTFSSFFMDSSIAFGSRSFVLFFGFVSVSHNAVQHHVWSRHLWSHQAHTLDFQLQGN
jgi:hypothetical protein